jgi:hypothetical protein
MSNESKKSNRVNPGNLSPLKLNCYSLLGLPLHKERDKRVRPGCKSKAIPTKEKPPWGRRF